MTPSSRRSPVDRAAVVVIADAPVRGRRERRVRGARRGRSKLGGGGGAGGGSGAGGSCAARRPHIEHLEALAGLGGHLKFAWAGHEEEGAFRHELLLGVSKVDGHAPVTGAGARARNNCKARRGAHENTLARGVAHRRRGNFRAQGFWNNDAVLLKAAVAQQDGDGAAVEDLEAIGARSGHASVLSPHNGAHPPQVAKAFVEPEVGAFYCGVEPASAKRSDLARSRVKTKQREVRNGIRRGQARKAYAGLVAI